MGDEKKRTEAAAAAARTHNLSIYVANRPGALARIAQTFSRRGFNIESLVVSPGKTAELSRMTITVKGEEAGLEQVIQQCSKLVDVVACREHDDAEVVSRELALVKIRAGSESRGEILQIAEYFRAKTVDMAEQAMVLEITGTPDKIDAMIGMLRKFEIEELIRTGKVIVARGDRAT
jgi:acetolactate synthase-1/3 small subunit